MALKQAILDGLGIVNTGKQTFGINRNFAKQFDWDEIAIKFENQIAQTVKHYEQA